MTNNKTKDNEHIWGRGACDVKGLIASMIGAAKQKRSINSANWKARVMN